MIAPIAPSRTSAPALAIGPAPNRNGFIDVPADLVVPAATRQHFDIRRMPASPTLRIVIRRARRRLTGIAAPAPSCRFMVPASWGRTATRSAASGEWNANSRRHPCRRPFSCNKKQRLLRIFELGRGLQRLLGGVHRRQPLVVLFVVADVDR